METKKIVLSIIIISWNVKEKLNNCLKSIMDIQDFSFEIIVIDNASKDGTVSFIKEKFPDIKIIENLENKGFPRANNQGIKVSRGEYILLLNPDTIVPKNTLEVCLQTIRLRRELGAIGVRLIYPDGTLQRESGRRFLSLWSIFCSGFYLNKIFPNSRIFNGHLMGEWNHSDDREVDCLSGAFMMIPRKILNQIGLLDEMMYFEDMEICYRIYKSGWKILLLGSQFVIHYGGESSNQSNDTLSLLDGEVKYRIIKMIHGRYAGFGCRLIIGIRSIFRLFLGLLIYLPTHFFWNATKKMGLFRFSHNLLMIKWSIFPKSVIKFIPKYALPDNYVTLSTKQ